MLPWAALAMSLMRTELPLSGCFKWTRYCKMMHVCSPLTPRVAWKWPHQLRHTFFLSCWENQRIKPKATKAKRMWLSGMMEVMRLGMWSWWGMLEPAFSECPAVSSHPALLPPSLKASCANSKQIRTLSHSIIFVVHFHQLTRLNKAYHEPTSILLQPHYSNLIVFDWCMFSTARQKVQTFQER